MSQIPGVIDSIRQNEAQFIELRRQIHSHPELGFEEHVTSALVEKNLRAWGYEVTTGLGGTGMVAQLRRGDSARSIGIRADMDALPVQEETGLPYASKVAGCMHACGHDGHTAILLAAAHYLAHEGSFNGTVNLIFQPAEEGLGGAARMIADGLFERFPCDMIFGLHNGPTLPVGSFVVQPGVIAASSDTVRITLRGKGTHGGMPHMGNDPIVAMGAIIVALQSIVARNVAPDQPAVISIGKVAAGETANVIPDTAHLALTVRTFNPQVQALIEKRIRELVAGQAASYGVEAEIEWKPISRVLANAREPSALARSVAEAMVGAQAIIPLPAGAMGGDDFSWMLEQVPGCYLVLGNGVESHGGCMLHNPGYDFNDRILALGASFWARLTEEYLQ
ncbi:M20 aminoacylase family protein [Thalassolituus sp. LLYu03]|uniref:M20 aminoacylase family protein n=1 Tax=Thalassolituus sp. LLYu03 TaxID=3421656 RepID=UPI003D29E179